MEPLISSLPLENQREFPNLMSITTKNKFEKSDLFENLSLKEKQAHINLQNAQAQHYKDQTELNREKLNNPSNSVENSIKIDTAKSNRKTIETKIIPEIKSIEGELKVFDIMENTLKSNPNLVGSDLQSKLRRSLVTAFGLEDSVGIDFLKLNSIEFEKRLRPLLGAQLGQDEGNRVLSKYISLDNDPKAIRKYLQVQGKELRNEIARNKSLLDQYNRDPSANLFSPEYYENEKLKEKHFVPNNVDDVKTNRGFKLE